MQRPCRRAVLPVILSFFMGSPAYGLDAAVKVEIRVVQSPVKNNEEFPISTAIRNVGGGQQTLGIWSCSYPEQWTADNPAVHIAVAACNKNDVVTVKLKPGEAYERTLSIHIETVAKHHEQKPITFRLGFQSASRMKTQDNPVVWSNALTVSVLE